MLRRTRGHHSVPRIQVQRRLDAAVLEEVHERARLARDQLTGGGINGAAHAGREHPVEAGRRDVTQGDRDGRNPLGPGGLEADDLEPGSGLLGVQRLAVQLGALLAPRGELLAGAEVAHVAELDVLHGLAGRDRDAERMGR